jgi:hypothetical protein
MNPFSYFLTIIKTVMLIILVLFSFYYIFLFLIFIRIQLERHLKCPGLTLTGYKVCNEAKN